MIGGKVAKVVGATSSAGFPVYAKLMMTDKVDALKLMIKLMRD